MSRLARFRGTAVTTITVDTHALEAKVMPLLGEGRCRPVMDSTYALEEVAKAHARMDGGEHIGKIVLTV